MAIEKLLTYFDSGLFCYLGFLKLISVIIIFVIIIIITVFIIINNYNTVIIISLVKSSEKWICI